MTRDLGDTRYGKEFFGVQQAANLSISNSATLTNSALVSPTLDAGTYIVHFAVYGESLASTVPGWSYRFNFTGSSAGRMIFLRPTAASGGSPAFTGLTVGTTQSLTGAASNFLFLEGSGTINVFSSGVFSFQISQQTSDSNAVVLNSISFMSIKKL